jgi:phospholipid-binding lipoprotein MlaA
LSIAVGLALAGCASAPGNGTPDDPFEPVNRTMFGFNQKLDRNAALPAATFYKSAVPGGLRTGVHNVLSNLGLPVTFANDVLQGEVSRAGESIGRLCINTTIGLGGILDPATGWGLPYHAEDFGQTLGVYGTPGGPYMVLPLLGSALPRDLVGRIFVDHYFSPLGYVSYRGKYYVSISERVLSSVDGRSRVVDKLRDIERNSVDYYATMRDGYIKHRQDEIDNVAPSSESEDQPPDPMKQ